MTHLHIIHNGPVPHLTTESTLLARLRRANLTNARLHRRCQIAEAAAHTRYHVAERDGVQFVGGSLARALLRSMVEQLDAEVLKLRREITELKRGPQ